MTDLSPSTSLAPDATTLPPVIEVEGATVALGGHIIWQEVRLSVQPGEFLAILGPNGAGKSTLLKAILGLIPLSRGTISVLGHPARRGNAAIGYVPQRRHFEADVRVRGRSIVRLGLDGGNWGLPLPFLQGGKARNAARRVQEAFAGESLSDVAFTGALGGAVLGINPLVSLLVMTVVVALVMGGFGQRLRERDVAIGTVLAWVLGVGVLFLSLFTAHVSGTGTGFSGVTVLFGNILGISIDQMRTIAFISGAAVLALVIIARPLLFASLDPDVAAARGVPVRALGLGFMALLAVTVSEATLAVGALLVFALLLLPAAIAHQVTSHPYAALALAGGLAVACTWLGITIGFYTGYPSSVCISLLAFASYVAVVGGRYVKENGRIVIYDLREEKFW